MNVALHSEIKLLGMNRYQLPEKSPIKSVEESKVTEDYHWFAEQNHSLVPTHHYVDNTGNILPPDIPYEEQVTYSKAFLLPQEKNAGLLFSENSIYHYVDSLKDSIVHTFTEESIDQIIGIIPVNTESIVLISEQNMKPKYLKRVWLVNLSNYTIRLLEDKAFYPHMIMPRKYDLPDMNGTVIVTYSEILSWGFGGDVYRPRYNKLHLFSEDYPNGIHLFTSTFKAGLVTNVQYNRKNHSLEVFSDPARPTVARDEHRSTKIHKFTLKLN